MPRGGANPGQGVGAGGPAGGGSCDPPHTLKINLSRKVRLGSCTAGTAALSFNYLLPSLVRAAVEPPSQHAPGPAPDPHRPARQPATPAPVPVPPPAHGPLTPACTAPGKTHAISNFGAAVLSRRSIRVSRQ